MLQKNETLSHYTWYATRIIQYLFIYIKILLLLLGQELYYQLNIWFYNCMIVRNTALTSWWFSSDTRRSKNWLHTERTSKSLRLFRPTTSRVDWGLEFWWARWRSEWLWGVRFLKVRIFKYWCWLRDFK